MKRSNLFFLMAITLLSIAPVAHAQFFAEISTGYAAPLYFTGDHENYDNMFRDRFIYNNDTTYITKKYNMGNGVFACGGFGFKSKGKFIFSIDGYYLNNYIFPLTYNSFQNASEGENYYTNNNENNLIKNAYNFVYSYYGERLSITPKIGLFQNINSLSVEMDLGLTFSTIKIYQISDKMLKTTYEPENDDGISQKEWTQLLKECYKKNILISPNLSLQVYYSINSDISIFSSISWSPVIHFYATDAWQYYNEETYNENGSLIYNIIDNNTIKIDATNQKYYNLSSLNFSLGIRYYFNKNTSGNNE